MPTVSERHRERAREWCVDHISVSKLTHVETWDSLAALLAEVESEAVRADQNKAQMFVVPRVHAALQARCAALEAALRMAHADSCDVGDGGCAANGRQCYIDAALSGSDSALKDMLVRACMEAWNGRGYPSEAGDSQQALAEAIAERVMRGE